MSTDRDAINDFLFGGAAKAFAFEAVGDTVSGEITELDLRQQTSMEDGTPMVWADGRPRMVMVVTLQTELRTEDEDDGMRTVWLRGGNYVVASGAGTSSLTAVRDAIKKAGAADIAVGANLTLKYSGMGKPSNRGMNAPKLYQAAYRPPVMAIGLDELA